MAKVAIIKTQQNEASVTDFLESVADETRKADSYAVMKMMEQASGEKPKMWGKAMIGFGLKRYKSPATGREVDWFHIGFSPRKSNLSLHLVIDIKKHEALLKKLGKHKTGVGCLYINKLADVDTTALKALINESLKSK